MTLKSENSPEELVEKTFEKLLFPTPIYSFNNPELQTKEVTAEFFKLCESRLQTMSGTDLLQEEANCIEMMKKTVFAIAKQLPEFEGKIPQFLGSNIIFQQIREHVPIHAYEHIPLVFSFIMHTDEWRPRTYYADPRGGVQTISRNRVSTGIVETSFSIIGNCGEIIVTPGYLQRYIESNLGKQTYVVFDVLVGFTA